VSDRGQGRRLARSTAFFSIATGLSRVLGLVREVVAASLFGVSGAMSAFTIAFQVPNLVRALFADSALQGAFVPVFTELLEKGERKEAFRVASSLFFLICLVLGALTLVFILLARPIMGVFTPGFDDNPMLADLTVNLARLMFPIVLMLALSGGVVGMLNSFEHFSVPAIAPVAWNLVHGVNDPPTSSERTVWVAGQPSEPPPSRFAAPIRPLPAAVDTIRLSG